MMLKTSAPLEAFLAAEVRNEEDGGISPATLGSALESLSQMDQEILANLNFATAEADYVTLMGELSDLVSLHGRNFEIAETVDLFAGTSFKWPLNLCATY
jgi:hypothetical protein